MKHEDLSDVPAIESGQTLTVDDVGNARVTDRDGRVVWSRPRSGFKAHMWINGERYDPVSVECVSRESAIRLFELAVLGWCAEHSVTIEEAFASRAGPGFACACMGPPINIAGFPCHCEAHFICEQIALGEEPVGWVSSARGKSWRQWLAEDIFPEFPDGKPGHHPDGWPKGKRRPLP